jgi:hypothetical protein
VSQLTGERGIVFALRRDLGGDLRGKLGTYPLLALDL